MTVVHDAELMTVGPDEAVVTFRTDGDEPVTTRVGDAEVTTRGPYHSARVAGLEAGTEYELVVDGAERSEWLVHDARASCRPPPGDDRNGQRRALRRGRVRSHR